MKTRWKILIGAGILLVLAMASAWMTAHHRPQSAVEAYKKLLREKGEKLEISEVVPMPTPAASNGVAAVQMAFKELDTDSGDYTNLPVMMQMAAPGKAIVGWTQPDLRVTMGANTYTNTWENAEAAVADNRAAVESFVQAATFPTIDFHLDYSKGPELLLPHLASFKLGAQRLAATAMCDMRMGDAASATTNICTVLALEQADADERITISQLVRIAMANIAVAASWELLQANNLTEGELAALQRAWEHQEYIASMKEAFEFERASNDETIRRLQASKADYDRMLSAYTGSSAPASGWAGSGDWLEDMEELGKQGFIRAKRRTADYMWRESWSYDDQLHALQGMQIGLEAMRTIQTNQFFQPTMGVAITNLDKLHDASLDSGWMAEFNGWLGGPLRDLFSGGMGFVGGSMRKVLSIESARRVVITAIALKRFQLKHGNFPETLSELTPEFLASVPLDPVDGKPLRYRREADGTFLLYSIGDDGIDNGGDITPVRPATAGSTANWNWQRGHDWVWPQPAMAAEIKAFQELPPK